MIFVARLAWGTTPGEALHVVAGVGLTAVYAAYQWRHWRRVATLRWRLDHTLGVLGAASVVLANVSGLVLGVSWLRDRVLEPVSGEVRYSTALSALHNVGSLLVLTFVGAHLGVVLARDRRRDQERALSNDGE